MNAKETINMIRQVYNSDRFQFEFNCAVYLAGDNNKRLRQEIVKEITGELLPVSKCGLHRVSDTLKNSFEQLQLF